MSWMSTDIHTDTDSHTHEKESLFRHEAYRGVGCALTVKVPKTDPLQLQQTAASDDASSPLCLPILLLSRAIRAIRLASVEGEPSVLRLWRSCAHYSFQFRQHYCVNESRMIDISRVIVRVCIRDQLQNCAHLTV